MQSYFFGLPRQAVVFVFAMCCLLAAESGFSQTKNPRQLVVILVDQSSGEALPGAVVALGKYQTVTDNEGKAVFAFPQGKQALLSAQTVGYKPIQRVILRSEISTTPIRIEMQIQVEALDAVTIVAEKPRTVSTSVAVRLSQASLKESTGKNLAEILSQLPGISSISTGATIMKPVIQGMHSNRVLLINNGVRQEGQQWGADHAPEVDASSATDLEVIKGAESVRYGAGAIGGVILLRSASLPVAKDFKGSVSLRGGTNALGLGANTDLYGGADFLPGFRWRAQLGTSVGRDYKTADYYLNNTGMRETSATLAAGVRTKRLEVEAFGSYFFSRLGIFFGSHIGTLEDLYERFKIGRPSVVAPPSFDIKNPKQQVAHIITRVDGKWRLGKAGLIKLQYDFQQDNRQEYEIRRGDRNEKPSLGLLLRTHSLQGAWESDKAKPIRFIAGTAYSYQTNQSDDDAQSVPMIPNFLAQNAGAYFIAKYVRPSFEIEAGARYDYKYIDAKGYDRNGKPYGGTRRFHSPTFSLSGLVRPTNDLSLHTNIGLAWRAPEVNELYSDGLHHGAGTYEIGDQSLDPEQGLKWNNEIQYHNRYLSVNATGFVQWIGNYIFDQPSRDQAGNPETWRLMAGVFPVFRYRQVNAFFCGGDVVATVRPIENLSYTVQGQWIRARNRATDGYFPYIPSDRYTQEARWSQNFNHQGLCMYSVSLQHTYVTKQNEFDPGIDFVPVSPPGYHLFGAKASVAFRVGRLQRIEIDLNAENLLNRLYKEYTNRFRYYAHEKGRDVQLRLRYEF